MGLISSLLKYIVLAFSIFNNKLCISRIFFAQTASACPITIKPRQKPFFSILYRKFSWHRNTKNKGMLYSLLYSSFLHFEHCAYVGCWLLSISQMVSLNTQFSAFTFSFPPYFSAIACMLFMP